MEGNEIPRFYLVVLRTLKVFVLYYHEHLTQHHVKEEKKELLYNHTLKPCELLSFPLDHDLQHDFHIVNKDLLQMK